MQGACYRESTRDACRNSFASSSSETGASPHRTAPASVSGESGVIWKTRDQHQGQLAGVARQQVEQAFPDVVEDPAPFADRGDAAGKLSSARIMSDASRVTAVPPRPMAMRQVM
jgi:hypothetical protein